MRHVRGEEAPVGEPAYLGLDLPGGIPDGYVPDGREKFRLFRRIASTGGEPELDDLVQELEDRFGPLPPDVRRLALAQRVRLRAGRLGIVRLDPAERPGAILRVPPPGPGTGLERIRQEGFRLLPLEATAAFLPTDGADTTEAVLEAVADVLGAVLDPA